MSMLRTLVMPLLLCATLAACVYEPYPSYGYSSYQPSYGGGYGYGYGPSYNLGFSYYGGGGGCCYGGNGYWHHRHWHDYN